MRHYELPEDPAGTVFDPTDDTFGPIMAALQHGEFEVAQARIGKLIPPSSEDVAMLRRVMLAGAADSDSNDEEIEALQEALDLVMARAGVEWPEFPEIGIKYIDSSHSDEPVFTVDAVSAIDRVVEMDNGQWYVLDGPEGFLAKLDAGTIRPVT